MTDERMRLTRSIDHVFIEVYNDNGADYVHINNSNLQGKTPGFTFLKGNEDEAFKILSNLGKLMGVDIIQEKPCPPEK